MDFVGVVGPRGTKWGGWRCGAARREPQIWCSAHSARHTHTRKWPLALFQRPTGVLGAAGLADTNRRGRRGAGRARRGVCVRVGALGSKSLPARPRVGRTGAPALRTSRPNCSPLTATWQRRWGAPVLRCSKCSVAPTPGVPPGDTRDGFSRLAVTNMVICTNTGGSHASHWCGRVVRATRLWAEPMANGIAHTHCQQQLSLPRLSRIGLRILELKAA